MINDKFGPITIHASLLPYMHLTVHIMIQWLSEVFGYRTPFDDRPGYLSGVFENYNPLERHLMGFKPMTLCKPARMYSYHHDIQKSLFIINKTGTNRIGLRISTMALFWKGDEYED